MHDPSFLEQVIQLIMSALFATFLLGEMSGLVVVLGSIRNDRTTSQLRLMYSRSIISFSVTGCIGIAMAISYYLSLIHI